MVKASVESLLRAELKDIIFELVSLNSISFELQYKHDIKHYRHWLRNSITYTILARQVLGSKERYRFNQSVDMFSNLDDLRKLTERVINNYKRILLAYDSEIGDELKQILHIVLMCLMQLNGK